MARPFKLTIEAVQDILNKHFNLYMKPSEIHRQHYTQLHYMSVWMVCNRRIYKNIGVPGHHGKDPQPPPNKTEIQMEKVLEFIYEYDNEYGVSPTQDEVGDELGVSAEYARGIIKKLHAFGRIDFIPYVQRGIRIPSKVNNV
jgi:hypothetical protein